jgi:hypothetical protein
MCLGRHCGSGDPQRRSYKDSSAVILNEVKNPSEKKPKSRGVLQPQRLQDDKRFNDSTFPGAGGLPSAPTKIL